MTDTGFRNGRSATAGRHQLLLREIDSVAAFAHTEYRRELDRKGPGIFTSRHEILGVVAEEYWELTEAIHSGDADRIQDELRDIAVAALHGLASLKSGRMDW